MSTDARDETLAILRQTSAGAWAVREIERLKAEVEALNAPLPADQQYIELNLSNYDLADVEQLNAWGIWAHGEIERLTEQVRLLKRDNANLQASQERLNAERQGIDVPVSGNQTPVKPA